MSLEPESAADRLIAALDAIRPRLKQILWSFRLRREEAEDILQDLVIVALDHLDRTKIEDLEAWLISTLRYRCLMFLRAEEARLRRQSVWAELESVRQRQAGLGQLARELRSCLSMLPRRQRLILLLRLAGHSNTEVAARTGTTVNIVRRDLLLAYRRLRDLMSDLA
jgi:RNA polymerase sigma factor (sigma-70 family)